MDTRKLGYEIGVLVRLEQDGVGEAHPALVAIVLDTLSLPLKYLVYLQPSPYVAQSEAIVWRKLTGKVHACFRSRYVISNLAWKRANVILGLDKALGRIPRLI